MHPFEPIAVAGPNLEYGRTEGGGKTAPPTGKSLPPHLPRSVTMPVSAPLTHTCD